MKLSGTFSVTVGLLVLGTLACGETERNEPPPFPVQSGSSSGGQATSGAGAAQGGGATASAGQGGAAVSAAGAGGSVAEAAPKPTPVTAPITDVVKSAGCGKPYTGAMSSPITLQTMGVKAADCADKLNDQPVCGPWRAARTYNVFLPAFYDPEKPYSLVIVAPGCGGTGSSIPTVDSNVSNTIIRVGVAPGPNDLGHGTNPNQGCFDNREGDDSIDWVMYEQLYDRLNADLCFDRNRLFVGGISSGAWFASELGCKYAGDALRPVRAILPNGGALPTDKASVPACTSSPLAGMWIHQVDSVTTPFAGAKVAIERSMALNACANGTSYDSAPSELFPIGGGKPDDTCQRISGCNPLFPIVVCPLPGPAQTINEDVMQPGWATFIKMFQAPPFVAE